MQALHFRCCALCGGSRSFDPMYSDSSDDDTVHLLLYNIESENRVRSRQIVRLGRILIALGGILIVILCLQIVILLKLFGGFSFFA